MSSSAWALSYFEEALHCFQQACTLDLSNPAHWSNIVLALRDLKQPHRAINAFRTALLLKPNFAAALNEWGNVLIDINQPQQAQVYYQKAQFICDNRAVYHHNYGVCKKQLEQWEAAMQCFEKALVLNKKYHHSLEELGLLLLEVCSSFLKLNIKFL